MVRFFWNGIREHFQTISWKNILKLNRSALPRKLWQPFARLSSTVDDIFHNGPGGNTVCIDSSVKRWPKASKVSRFHRRVKFIMEHGFLRENCAASPFLYWRERERERKEKKNSRACGDVLWFFYGWKWTMFRWIKNFEKMNVYIFSLLDRSWVRSSWSRKNIWNSLSGSLVVRNLIKDQEDEEEF